MSRREFSIQVRRDARQRSEGRCEATGTVYGLRPGQRCNMPLDRGVEFDHATADGLGGEATLENCVCVCKPCHAFKSARHDTPAVAKMKRQRDKHLGLRKSSRPMPGSRASKWKNKMDGTIEKR